MNPILRPPPGSVVEEPPYLVRYRKGVRAASSLGEALAIARSLPQRGPITILKWDGRNHDYFLHQIIR